jgi:hypothetical protein
VLYQRLFAAALLLAPTSLFASTITLDFEGLADSTFVSTQYSGVVFANAQVLTAGVSLDEFELPPHSGVNVVSDYSGPMSIIFATPVSSVSGYFTYGSPLTIDAFDSALSLIGSVSSAFSNNFALSGDPGSSPNELLQLNAVSGISELTITGLASGGSFALDDFTFTTGAVSNVPEPGTLGLIGCFAFSTLTWRIRRARSGRF